MHIFWGKVRKGQGRGKGLGYPTANISLHRYIPEGIYISQTKIDQKEFPSITFIGSPKTFDEKDYKSETYVLDYRHNLYGKWASVHLLGKIRDNKKFVSVKDLKNQMKEDEKEARKYFLKNQES